MKQGGQIAPADLRLLLEACAAQGNQDESSFNCGSMSFHSRSR